MQNSIERFKSAFPDNHNLIVALHSKSLEHALEGADIAISNGAHGIALVTHAITPTEGISFANRLKQDYPYHKVSLNVLQRDPYKFWDKNMQRDPLTLMQIIHYSEIDGIRTDKSMIPWIDMVEWHEKYADKVLERQKKDWYNKLYLGGLDFKHQKHLDQSEYSFAIQQAKKYLDVITTSGPATGISADVEKIARIKWLAGQHPVGLASGVTPENIHEYIRNTDISIVATGISKDYWNLEPTRVLELATIIYKYNKKMARKRFEQETLVKYNINSVPELDKYIRENFINIWSRPEYQEVEKKLSNLYPSPFTLDWVGYASIEAFRMHIKYPKWYPNREKIRLLSWMDAKRSWDDAKFIKSFIYQWKIIEMWSDEHHTLLKRALKAKLEQHPDILQALLDTGDRPLAHIIFAKDTKFLLPDSKIIPWEKLAQLYTELRNEFRNK